MPLSLVAPGCSRPFAGLGNATMKRKTMNHVCCRVASVKSAEPTTGAQLRAPRDVDVVNDPLPTATTTTTTTTTTRTWLSAHNAMVVCGRLAMMGFAVGVVNEVATQQPLAAQLFAGAPTAAAAAALVAFGSVVPWMMGEQEGDEMFGPFDFRAEAVNGSLACVGVITALLLEALRGGAPLL